jgi:hypothetical protein
VETLWALAIIAVIVIPLVCADTDRVEVVGKKKLVTDLSEQSWESKTLRDISDVINGQPMR